MSRQSWWRSARVSDRAPATARAARAALAALAGAALLCPGAALSQDLAILYTPDQSIPTEYESWSLFLVCNQAWLGSGSHEQLEELYDQFLVFGDLIGSRHVAVWFWKQRPRLGSAELFEDVDVGRAAAFCTHYGVEFARGPHVVITTKYPDPESETTGNIAVLELDGTAPDEIARMLSSTAQLVRDRSLWDQEPDTRGWWFSLGAAIYETMVGGVVGVTKDIKVMINTEYFTTELVPRGGGADGVLDREIDRSVGGASGRSTGDAWVDRVSDRSTGGAPADRDTDGWVGHESLAWR